MSRYSALTAVLREAAERGQQTVAMSFGRVEEIIGGALPPSSDQRQWWANSDHVQAQAWLAAEFRVEQVDLDRKQVRFVRAGGQPSEVTIEAPPTAEDPPLHAGDSSEQRRAERLMLAAYQEDVDLPLRTPFLVSVAGGARMEFDAGYDGGGANAGLLVEAWAHQGPPKAAQKKKIIGDAFKLAFGSTLLEGQTRLVLLFSDEEARRPFLSERAWSSAAFAHFGIETVVVDLPDDERAILREAQRRQYR